MTPQNLSTLEEGQTRYARRANLLDRDAYLTDEALGMHERMAGKALANAKKARDETFKVAAARRQRPARCTPSGVPLRRASDPAFDDARVRRRKRARYRTIFSES